MKRLIRLCERITKKDYYEKMYGDNPISGRESSELDNKVLEQLEQDMLDNGWVETHGVSLYTNPQYEGIADLNGGAGIYYDSEDSNEPYDTFMFIEELMDIAIKK